MRRLTALLAALALTTALAQQAPDLEATYLFGVYLASNTSASPIDCPEELAANTVCLALLGTRGAAAAEVDAALARVDFTPIEPWQRDGFAAHLRGLSLELERVNVVHVFLFDADGAVLMVVGVTEL